MLDARIEAVRKEYGLSKDDFWQLPQARNVWCVKHAALEVVAAKAGIEFGDPQIIEADTANGIAVVAVRGSFKDRSIFSIGEASQKNCKNAYPWAMAEKRAVDRVILKLIGIHGLVYSEEEADDFKANQPVTKSSAALKRENSWETVLAEFHKDLQDCHTLMALESLKATYRAKIKAEGWTAAWANALKDEFDKAEEQIMNQMEKEEAA